MTTGEIAKTLQVPARNMAQRLLVLEKNGFLTRLDQSVVLTATWRFSEPEDFPPEPKKERVSFLGADCLQAMQKCSEAKR